MMKDFTEKIRKKDLVKGNWYMLRRENGFYGVMLAI